MRILHVLAPAPYGGLERVVAALTAGVAARGHEVHVAAVLDGGAEGHPFLRELRVPSHVIPAPGRAYGAEMAAVDELRRRLRPDVVHTHGYRADVLHGRPAAATGTPSATTVHGFTGGGVRNQVYEAMQRLALRRFDAVVAVSEPLARQLRVTVPGDRVRTIPNAWSPAEPPLPRGEARARLGIGAGEFVAGWVGRLSPEKGADVLLYALRALPGVHASFLGDGSDAAALRAHAARLGVADRVRWHGPVPGAAALYAAFDVFVLSSRTEGTPIALFEAIAAGVPVVAARVGGVPHVVGPVEAWLVPPDTPAALAAALAEVRASPRAARARVDAARRRLESAFGCGPWLDAYESLYASLVSRSAR
ncbi:MAG TPA: glycosyltransferase family 4 protein [Longimicrobium sp.]|nr:glycosyltransferase family 4 protein [Longimicrobium sp.]